MAKQVWKNVNFLVDGYNLSGWTNACSMKRSADGPDNTAMGGTTHIVMPGGLESVELGLSGFVDHATGATDEVIDTRLAVANSILTVCPLTGAAGEACYFMKGVGGSYELGGTVGDAHKFSGSFGAQTRVIRGTVFATGEKTLTGNSDTFTLGAVSASQHVYAALHVTAVSGTATPTITVLIKSDANDIWPAGATTQVTFSAATAIGAQYATPVAGAITDTYWRAYWTVSGTNPSLTVKVAVGIK
jgi:hypothetical protein